MKEVHASQQHWRASRKDVRLSPEHVQPPPKDGHASQKGLQRCHRFRGNASSRRHSCRDVRTCSFPTLQAVEPFAQPRGLGAQGVEGAAFHLVELPIHHAEAVVVAEALALTVEEVPVQGVEGAGVAAAAGFLGVWQPLQ